MFSAFKMIRETIDEGNLEKFIREELPNQYIVSKNFNSKSNNIEFVVVGDRISNVYLKKLQGRLKDYGFKNKSLTIKQNDNKISDIDKYINDINNKNNNFIINNKTKDINDLKNESKENYIDNLEISKELKAIYPQINRVYTGYLNV